LLTDKIKYLRKSNDLTQQEMADILKIKRSTYTNYESGKILPPIDKLELLAEHFKVSIDYLLGRTDDPTPYRDIKTTEDDLQMILSNPAMINVVKKLSSLPPEKFDAFVKLLEQF
jgi:transcriptional regulator with XRE-family HTH domain